MATLLHIDSSVFPGEASSSRSVTDAFRRAWEEQHPQGTVIYRDLAAAPVPHITADAWSAGYAAPCEHTPEQSAAFAARVKLIEELEQADAVLIGAPMYNYSIPSTLKAWLDNVLLLGRTAARPPPPRAPRPSSSPAAAAPTHRAPRPRTTSSYRTTWRPSSKTPSAWTSTSSDPSVDTPPFRTPLGKGQAGHRSLPAHQKWITRPACLRVASIHAG